MYVCGMFVIHCVVLYGLFSLCVFICYVFECAVCACLVWGCMVCRFVLNVLVCFDCGLMGGVV